MQRHKYWHDTVIPHGKDGEQFHRMEDVAFLLQLEIGAHHLYNYWVE